MNELFTYFRACSSECRPGPPKCHFIMGLQSSLALWPAPDRKLDIASCVRRQNMLNRSLLGVKCYILLKVLTDNKLMFSFSFFFFLLFVFFCTFLAVMCCLTTAWPWNGLSKIRNVKAYKERSLQTAQPCWITSVLQAAVFSSVRVIVCCSDVNWKF